MRLVSVFWYILAMKSRPGLTPRPLRGALSASLLVDNTWYDSMVALGSYWPRREDLDLQSALVKYLKTPCPSPMALPAMRGIVHGYAQLIERLHWDCPPTTVVRVLGSSETVANANRPQSLICDIIARSLGAQCPTDLFFRMDTRKPMRMVDRLSGPDVLRSRIHYVLQDLVVVPRQVGETVLLLDDICNLGATARVYAAALKMFCGAKRVYSVNLSAARLQQGRDGWGALALDIEAFLDAGRRFYAGGAESELLSDAWTERGANVYHVRPDCNQLAATPRRTIVLFAREANVPCPTCAAHDPRGAIRRLLDSL